MLQGAEDHGVADRRGVYRGGVVVVLRFEYKRLWQPVTLQFNRIAFNGL